MNCNIVLVSILATAQAVTWLCQTFWWLSSWKPSIFHPAMPNAKAQFRTEKALHWLFSDFFQFFSYATYFLWIPEGLLFRIIVGNSFTFWKKFWNPSLHGFSFLDFHKNYRRWSYWLFHAKCLALRFLHSPPDILSRFFEPPLSLVVRQHQANEDESNRCVTLLSVNFDLSSQHASLNRRSTVGLCSQKKLFRRS